MYTSCSELSVLLFDGDGTGFVRIKRPVATCCKVESMVKTLIHSFGDITKIFAPEIQNQTPDIG